MKKEKIVEVTKKSSIPVLEPGKGKHYLKFKKGETIAVRRISYQFLDPAIIISLTVSVMLLAIGAFAYFTLTDTTQELMGDDVDAYDNTFSVANPNVDKTCATGRTDMPTADIVVYQYNGVEWKVVPTAGWQYSGSDIIVNYTYMEG